VSLGLSKIDQTLIVAHSVRILYAFLFGSDTIEANRMPNNAIIRAIIFNV